jgi:hypothetical protein
MSGVGEMHEQSVIGIAAMKLILKKLLTAPDKFPYQLTLNTDHTMNWPVCIFLKNYIWVVKK